MTRPPQNVESRPVPSPNQRIWPGLDVPPPSPREHVARALFHRAVAPLAVRVLLPDGRRLGAGGPGSPVMHLHRPADFYRRLGARGLVGFGEAYLVGDWTCPELPELLTPLARRSDALIPPVLQRLRRLVVPRAPVEEHNTLQGARDNIRRHYDLSNELFAAFLDETMTYSCAWFADDPTDSATLSDSKTVPEGLFELADRTTGPEELADAQLRKIDGILDLAGVRAGQHILEIGTGWGSLAIRAARLGARVTTLTISAEQRELAQRRIEQAGVADRVQVLLRDYREAHGSYHAVVSVEMIEAVGAEYWPTYFQALDRLLAPGGRIGLQSITMGHRRMLATRDNHSWIHKYVFPGGRIPSVTAIERNLALHTELRISSRRSLGPHYARTLALWRRRFQENGARVSALGFDETFRRMWEFYLAYCEAGFRSGYLDLYQFALSRPGD